MTTTWQPLDERGFAQPKNIPKNLNSILAKRQTVACFYARSYRVSVHIPNDYIRGQNALWKLQKNKTIAQTNVFVQSCSSFRVQPVKIHESSANHLRATITILSLILHFWTTQIGTRQVGHQVYSSGWWAGKKWIWIPASCNYFNFVITPNHLHWWTINGSSSRYMKAMRERSYILKK